MKMRPVEGGLEIKPGETVALKPSGVHMMLIDLKHPLEQGKTAAAILKFEHAGVADEMSLPTVAWSRTGDIPPATQWAISGDLAKRIIGEGWTQIGHSGGPTMA